MTILDRYLFKRLLTLGVFGLVVFTIAWLAPEIMFQAVQGVAQHQITIPQALAYLLYQMPTVMSYCLPITALFSSVFLFRQLSISLELTAMQASGISFVRLLVPVALAGIVYMGVFILNQEFATPLSQKQLQNLTATTHFDEEETQPNPYVTFVERNSHHQLKKLLIIMPSPKAEQSQFVMLLFKSFGEGRLGIQRIVSAYRGDWNRQHQRWHLENGWVYQLGADGIFVDVKPFDRLAVKTSPVIAQLFAMPHGKPNEMMLGTLHHYVQLLKDSEQMEDARFYDIRLMERYTVPLVTLIFTVVGAALGVERARSRKHFGLIYAALIILLYNVVLSTATTMGSMGILPVFIAALVPPVAAGGIGWVFIKLRQREG